MKNCRNDGDTGSDVNSSLQVTQPEVCYFCLCGDSKFREWFKDVVIKDKFSTTGQTLDGVLKQIMFGAQQISKNGICLLKYMKSEAVKCKRGR